MTQLAARSRVLQAPRGAVGKQVPLSQILGVMFMSLLLFVISLAVVSVSGLCVRTFLITANVAVMLIPIIVRLARGTFDLFEPLLMVDFSMMGMYVGRLLADIFTGHFFEHSYEISATWDWPRSW